MPIYEFECLDCGTGIGRRMERSGRMGGGKGCRGRMG